jgi:hypothetical protein
MLLIKNFDIVLALPCEQWSVGSLKNGKSLLFKKNDFPFDSIRKGRVYT